MICTHDAKRPEDPLFLALFLPKEKKKSGGSLIEEQHLTLFLEPPSVVTCVVAESGSGCFAL